jgi:hypothetical protein
MRRYALFTLLLFVLSARADAPREAPLPASDFQQLYDHNDTFSAPVGNFDSQLWSDSGALRFNVTPTLRIRLKPNLFLTTMAVVSVTSDGPSSDVPGIDMILFGIEYRFRGF